MILKTGWAAAAAAICIGIGGVSGFGIAWGFGLVGKVRCVNAQLDKAVTLLGDYDKQVTDREDLIVRITKRTNDQTAKIDKAVRKASDVLQNATHYGPDIGQQLRAIFEAATADSTAAPNRPAPETPNGTVPDPGAPAPDR